MPGLTPADIAKKQIQNLSNATTYIESGVRSVTESPTGKAADNVQKALDGYKRAVESGKMAANLRAVSLEEWKAKTLAKVSRVAEGAEASINVIVAFHTQRAEWQKEIDAKLAAMPTRTLAENIRRMTEQVTAMAGKTFDRTRIGKA